MNNPFCLTEEVYIDGAFFKIHTDFRTWIGYERIMFSDISHIEKCVNAIKLCYIELPPRIDKAAEALMDFYLAGDTKRSNTKSKPLFDFEKDFGYIYASFVSEYQIDLFDSDLHWHKFIYLLRAMSDESVFKKIIGYRGADLSKIKDKNLKAFLRRMKHLYVLEPDEDADISDAF